MVEHEADWQVKIAVTSRPFLEPYQRLAHITLLHRADMTSGMPHRPDSDENAYPAVAGYRIDSTVIRVIPTSGFGDECHAIVSDLVTRHIDH